MKQEMPELDFSHADAHQRHAARRSLLVGGDGIPVEEFLARPVAYWLAD